jgi:hypothetical protein
MSASGGRPAPRHKASRVPMGDKISSICSHIEKFQLNPKTFLTAFLHHSSINAAFRRRFWGTVGWASTRRLLMNIKLLVCKHSDGQRNWDQFILDEVNSCWIWNSHLPAEAQVIYFFWTRPLELYACNVLQVGLTPKVHT